MVKNKRWRLLSANRSIACFFAAVIASSCNVFSPRDAEMPDVSVPKDPLNFSAILAGTGYQFNSPRYEDIFSNGAHYENNNTGLFPRDRLIQRLLQVQRLMLDQSSEVVWTGGEIVMRDNMIFINGIVYHAPGDSGVSYFTVTRDQEWRIAYWRDIPTEKGKSLFSP